MSDLRKIQLERNLETRDAREHFGQHRTQVMQKLMASRQSDRDRICILGAGNCNDLDLEELTAAFSRVHLVDVDQSAMQTAVESTAACNIQLHVLDLTGWYDTISANDIDPAVAIDRIASAAKSFRPTINDSPFDVVASTCLLSQINESAVRAIGHEHPGLAGTIFDIRRQHLLSMLDLARVGGRVVFFTDFVSSVTLPQLADVSATELPELLSAAVDAGNFFTGLNPVAVTHLLTVDEELRKRASKPRLSLPWVWDLRDRSFAVASVSFQRVG